MWLGWFPVSGRASVRTEIALNREGSTGIYLIDAIASGNPAYVQDVPARLPPRDGARSGHGRDLPPSGPDQRHRHFQHALRGRSAIARHQRVRLVRKHAYKLALIPIITVIGLHVALLLGGAVLTETTFEWQGLGFQLTKYLAARDFVAVQAIVALIAILVALTNFVVDLIAALIDPRVKVLTWPRPTPPASPACSTAFPSSTGCVRASGSSAECSSPASSWVGIFLLLAILAPWLAPYGYSQLRGPDGLFGAQQPPSPEHLDGRRLRRALPHHLGRAAGDFAPIIVALVLSVFIGILLGLVSGYMAAGSTECWRRRQDSRVFPTLLLAIVAAIAISGGQSGLWPGILAAAVSITVVFIPQYFRAALRSCASRPRRSSLEVIGASTWRIMFFVHVLRNSTRSLPLIVTLNASEAIAILAALGFLGFGIEPDRPAAEGNDLNKSIGDVSAGIWWTAIPPGVAIVLAILGMTLIGEGLNDLADPRLRARRRAGKQTRADAVAAAAGHARVHGEVE